MTPECSDASTLSFGEAMDRLEAIVARMESDESLGLEEALALYEEGAALAAQCRQLLARAQLRLTELSVAPAAVEPPSNR